MDLAELSALSLPDQNGAPHRLGDLWQDRPVVLGPGDHVRYSHVDADSTDHASVPEILAAAGA
jgi:hypothetical protein